MKIENYLTVLKKIFNTIYYIFLGGLAVVALLLITSKFSVFGSYKTLMVLSGSMEPKIQMGSLVLIKGEAKYNLNDVVTYKGEGKTPVTHRIVEQKTEGFITRGDANNANDLKPVSEKNILGKVMFSIPYLGYLLGWAKTTTGIFVLIIIPAVLIIYTEALSIKKEIKKLIKEKHQKLKTAPVELTTNNAMPLPRNNQEHEQKRDKIGIKKIVKKGIQAVMMIFGLITILNSVTIEGTRASFVDEEKSSAVITAWVEDPIAVGDVLINEFLPNPEGAEYGFDFGNDTDAKPQGEWVELYNTTNQTIDLANYYLTDADNHRIDVEACRTNTDNTTIAPNGFLVVYARGSGTCSNSHNFSLNNDSDTVNFYNPTDQLFDSHSYTGNDYCDLKPTPGDPNANNPSCAGVPPNKSYARIPDGSATWVDPVPTPGKPNILEKEVKKDDLVIPLLNTDSTPAVIQITIEDDNDSTPANGDSINNPGDSTPATDTIQEEGNDNTEDPTETENITPAPNSDEPQADLTQENPAINNPPSANEENVNNPDPSLSLPPSEDPEPENLNTEETTSPPADPSPPSENLNNS